jgi:large subunit ribosomal protein MRP49
MPTIALQPDQPAPLHCDEQESLELTLFAAPDQPLQLLLNGQMLEPFLRPGEAIWRWRWETGGRVGQHDLLLQRRSLAGVEILGRWQLLIEPRKIDRDQFAALLDDLQSVALDLALRLGGASVGAVPSSEFSGEPLLAEVQRLFGERLDAFERAVQRIAARPRETLSTTQRSTPIEQAPPHSLGKPADLTQIVRLPEALAATTGTTFVPATVRAPQSQGGFDRYEHQLLKYCARELWRRARVIHAQLPDTLALAGLRLSCVSAQQRLLALLALPFLAGVGSLRRFGGVTPLLQRDPNYREVWRMWQLLRQHVLINSESELFHLPIAELPLLYERWCVLRVVLAVLTLSDTVLAQNLLRPSNASHWLNLELSTEQPLLVVQWQSLQLSLWYQRRYLPQQAGFGSLDHFVRIPDVALEIEQPGATPTVVVFDAKYRLTPQGGVPPDALADAYAYLGALGYRQSRAARAAVLLFPGSGNAELFASRVGLLPLLPAHSDHLEHLLRQLLSL